MSNNIFASNVRILKIVFTQVQVEIDEEFEEFDSEEEFNFKGVVCNIDTRFALREGQDENPTDFMLIMRFAIGNVEGRRAPCTVNIENRGIFSVGEAVPVEDRQKLAYVVGAQALYASIREMVGTITGRYPLGALTIPEVKIEAPEDI